MIIIFDKDGNYVAEAKSNNEAAEKSGVLAGSVSNITRGNYGNLSANGFYFLKHWCESESEKQAFIDQAERAIKLIVLVKKQECLQDKVENILKELNDYKNKK